MRRTRISIWLFVLSTVFSGQKVLAKGQDYYQELRSGTAYQLNQDQILATIQELNQKPTAQTLARFLNDSGDQVYDPDYTDWVVFINRKGVVHQGFVGADYINPGLFQPHCEDLEEKGMNIKLHDKRTLWAVVIAEVPIEVPGNTTTAAQVATPLNCSFVSLQTYVSPGASLFNSVASSKLGAAPASLVGDQSMPINLSLLGGPVSVSVIQHQNVKGKLEEKTTPKWSALYYGVARFSLNTSSINRCTVFFPDNFAALYQPPEKTSPLPDEVSQIPKLVVTNFGNVSNPPVGLSLMGGSQMQNFNPNALVAAHLFILSPDKPFSYGSLSLFAATDFPFNTNPIDEFLIGLTIGPGGLFQDVGLSLGYGFFKDKNSNGYPSDWFYGINYFL